MLLSLLIRARLGGLGFLVLAALSLAAMGCGIKFAEGDSTTELFEDLQVTGDPFPGGTLRVTLTYKLQYDVPVDILCDLLAAESGLVPPPTPTPDGLVPDPNAVPTVVPIPDARPTSTKKVVDLFSDTLPANEDGGPVGEATPVIGVIEREIQGPSVPGRYRVRCFTVRDENNAITDDLLVFPFPTAEPNPN